MGLEPIGLDCELERNGIGGTEDIVDGGPVPFCFAANDFRYFVNSCHMSSREDVPFHLSLSISLVPGMRRRC